MSNNDWGRPDQSWGEPDAYWQRPNHTEDASTEGQPGSGPTDSGNQPPPAPEAPHVPPVTGPQQPSATGGYQAPSTAGGYQPPPTAGGYQAPSMYGYQAPPSGGYQQPPTNGFQPPYSSYEQQVYSQTYSPYGGGYYASGPAYASFGKRAIGWLFDYMVPALAINLVLSVPAGLAGDSDLGNLIVIVMYAVMYLGWYYILSSMAGKTGKTPGRKLAKTKLVDADTGRPIGVGKAFLRYICHIADNLICYIGWLFPLWDAKRQTLADKIVSTVVIEDPLG